MVSNKIEKDKARSGRPDLVIAESTLPARSERFATQFQDANDEMVAFVERCTAEQWRQACNGEGWPVAVVAHHVASTQPAFIRLVEELASGATLAPRISMDVVDQLNALHAHDYAGVGKEDVLDLLRTSGDSMVRLLRGLTDAQLGVSTTVFGGRERSLAQMIEMIVIGHSRLHLASMRATVDQ